MPPWGSRKSLRSPAYEVFVEMLRQMRVRAGLTQAALVERLGREHNYISRCELGERRMDLIEWIELCRACGVKPEEFLAQLLERLAKPQPIV